MGLERNVGAKPKPRYFGGYVRVNELYKLDWE